MPTLTINASFAKSGTSSFNSSYVHIGQNTNGYRALLKFDLSPLANTTITSFKLYLDSTTSSQSNLTQAVRFRASASNAWGDATYTSSVDVTSTKISGSTRGYVWDFSSKAEFLSALQTLGAGAYIHCIEYGNTRQMQYEGIAGSNAAVYPRIVVTFTYNQSSFTLNKSTVDAGQSIGMTITPSDSSYTHNVTWKFGSNTSSSALAAGIPTASHTIPLAWLNAIPNGPSGTATATLETLSGGTTMGSVSQNFTITAPTSIVPTIGSFTPTRVNGVVPSGWAEYVQNKSKVTLTVNSAAGVYGSSIISYQVSGGGYSSNTNPYTTGFLTTSGSVTFTATITDSRGRVATANNTLSITVRPYAPPTISGIEIGRCLSNGTLDDLGTYIRVKATISCSSVNGKNSVSANVKYKVSTSGTWGSSVTLPSNTATVIGGGGILVDNSYDVLITATDALPTATTYLANVDTSLFTMHVKKGGRGVAFGKAAQTDDRVEINPDWGFYAGGKDLRNLTYSDVNAAAEGHNHTGVYAPLTHNHTMSQITDAPTDSGWINVTLTNGINVSGNPVRYRRIWNIVSVQGAFTGVSTNATVLFTLPVGYRPTGALQWFPMNAYLNPGQGIWIVQLNSSGTVTYLRTGTGNTGYTNYINFVFMI